MFGETADVGSVGEEGCRGGDVVCDDWVVGEECDDVGEVSLAVVLMMKGDGRRASHQPTK